MSDKLRRILNTPWKELTEEEREDWNAIEAAGIGGESAPPMTSTPLEELKAALHERFGEVISPEGLDFIARVALRSSRREVLEEAARVADEAQATAREEIALEKAEEGYDPYTFGPGFLSGELTASANIAKAIRALAEEK